MGMNQGESARAELRLFELEVKEDLFGQSHVLWEAPEKIGDLITCLLLIDGNSLSCNRILGLRRMCLCLVCFLFGCCTLILSFFRRQNGLSELLFGDSARKLESECAASMGCLCLALD
jgi:hypothetical protein